MNELKIKSYIPTIQSWMNTNISNKMSSRDIYPQLVKNCLIPNQISQQTFSSELSLAVKSGDIKGFYGVRGKFGGFVRDSSDSEQPISQVMPIISNDIEDNMAKKEKPENMFYLKINDGCEVRQVDSRNYQVTVGNKIGFASSIQDALKLLVSKTYEKEIKSVKTSQTLKDLETTLKEAEVNILKSIQEHIK